MNTNIMTISEVAPYEQEGLVVVKVLREQLIEKIGGANTSTYRRFLRIVRDVPKPDMGWVFDAR